MNTTEDKKLAEASLVSKVRIMFFVALTWFLIIHICPTLILRKELSWHEGFVNAFFTALFFGTIRWVIVP
jgi:hypothetical protein